MKRIAITVLGFLFASSAMSANWVVLHDKADAKYSIDTSTIRKVATILPTTGAVRSAWSKFELTKEINGASYYLVENYYKCKSFESAVNTFVMYGSNGKVIDVRYNVSGSSADLINYEPIIPDTTEVAIAEMVCALTAY